MIMQFSIYALDALLLSTLVYLVILMRRLKAFRVHERDMRKIVDDIVLSTDNARDLMAKLKISAFESQSAVDEQIEKARRVANDFDRRMSDAKTLLSMVDQVDTTLSQKNKNPPEPRDGHAKLQQGETPHPLDDIGDLAKLLRNKLAAAR